METKEETYTVTVTLTSEEEVELFMVLTQFTMLCSMGMAHVTNKDALLSVMTKFKEAKRAGNHDTAGQGGHQARSDGSASSGKSSRANPVPLPEPPGFDS